MSQSMLIDHPGFLADIIANPSSDVPRLIYADWLEEHGQSARARLIRTQVVLANMPVGPDGKCPTCCSRNAAGVTEHELDCKYNRLAMRAHHLLNRNRDAWEGPVRQMANSIELYFTWRRGFIELVALPTRVWHQIGPVIVRQLPLLEVILLWKKPTTRASGECTRAWWSCPFEELHSQAWKDYPGEAAVPAPLYMRLTGDGQPETTVSLARSCYTGPDADRKARQDLSNACLAWAKGKLRDEPDRGEVLEGGEHRDRSALSEGTGPRGAAERDLTSRLVCAPVAEAVSPGTYSDGVEGPMTEHPGLLTDVLAHPEDDTPRLNYADWLHDHGQQNRAQLIWTQIALSTAPWRKGELCPGCGCREGAEHAPSCKYQFLLVRAAQLLSWNHAALEAPYRGRIAPSPARFTWRRGFIEEATLTVESWRTHGPRLVRQMPLVRVNLLRKLPIFLNRGSNPRAWWACPYRDLCIQVWKDSPHPDEIPAPICLRLAGVGRAYEAANLARSFYTGADAEAQALADLSNACLVWAREQACPQ